MIHPAMAGRKVLIVDDIESNRKLMRHFLANSGMDIHEASSAQTALTEIKEWKPELVLMDIRMPSMSGEDAIIALRCSAEYANLPIIAVTANAMDGEKERLIKVGATDFISKPFTKAEMLTTICAVLKLDLHSAPVANVPTEPTAVQHQAAAPAEAKNVQQRDDLSILVVDDNRANQHLLFSQLKSLGLKADIAADGKSGLEMWQRKHYRVVFTDCSMPVMNGFDMTRSIRRTEASNDESLQPGAKPALIIAVTGSPEEYQERCRAAGMDDVLGKPLLLQSLNQMLVKHLAIA